MSERDDEFAAYVDARALVMRRTAYLLCGDWHRAEDLVQTALTKLYVAWPGVHRHGAVDAYVRTILVRASIDDSRRAFRRRETAVEELPDVAVDRDGLAEGLDVRAALARLAPGQRAAVVLRYWEDLGVTETAQLLGLSEGTVKSQASKGLSALRRLLVGARPVYEEQP
ncbi:SigE family RNA polymerase sigma factor [Umezawaea beigongshangensis]|uniref:SigE family RNA polymerase sigma factor n=1 Tax=Umezawaea beigongshangensis TaxID=2780383 RepID=UPI0018F1180A|nr:SigE family RNA polymerase sigma factor [Umezawaea beigongshangensis]